MFEDILPKKEKETPKRVTYGFTSYYCSRCNYSIEKAYLHDSGEICPTCGTYMVEME
jgi:rubrerythrin